MHGRPISQKGAVVISRYVKTPQMSDSLPALVQLQTRKQRFWCWMYSLFTSWICSGRTIYDANVTNVCPAGPSDIDVGSPHAVLCLRYWWGEKIRSFSVSNRGNSCMEVAEKTFVWMPKRIPLCKHCEVRKRKLFTGLWHTALELFTKELLCDRQILVNK